MRIVEVFTSLQGEGPIAGHPCTFVRFAGCNLKCSWCDTYYAQDPGGRLHCLSETEVWQALQLPLRLDHHHIVFTGGEPLLQQHAIKKIMDMDDDDYSFWVETNGTVSPEPSLESRTNLQFVVSPKIQSVSLETLKKFSSVGAFFKFVVGHESWDAQQVLALCEQIGVGRERLYFMPCGATRDEQLSNMPLLWDTCVAAGVRLSARLHTLAFGNRRGV